METQYQETPVGILVRYMGVSGEDEFLCTTLIPYNGGTSEEEVVYSYFKDFFGEGTKQEGKYTYFSPDGCKAVKVSGWDIIPHTDYAVLRKYFW